MHNSRPLEEIDYLVVGHLTIDLTPQGSQIGGTASYAALTARALGLRVGLVTSWGEEISSELVKTLPIANYYTEKSTTFENIPSPSGRIQFIHHVAPKIDFHMIPEIWRSAPVVHLGPVAQEVEPGIVRYFQSSLIGITPQGWLRSWDKEGHVLHAEWPEADFVLRQVGAAVLSLEDMDNDEARLEEMVLKSRILAVTEAEDGSRLYWNGDVRRFRAPDVEEVDPTGAGDIFAAAFFHRLQTTRDPWEAARFATLLSSYSVTRKGLDGIPTADEVAECKVEVL
jgi:sugar/nucleoside kinase (ribokinase family)